MLHLQNRLGDLYGLLWFLRMEALAIPDASVFRRCIERPLKQGDARAVMKLQVGCLLDCGCRSASSLPETSCVAFCISVMV